MNKREINKILKNHSLWLADNSKGRCANFSHLDLRKANFAYADLQKANFASANLSGADLSFAGLSHANLSQAALTNANLYCADLSHADLSHASIENARLRLATLTEVNFSHTEFSNADFYGTQLIDGGQRRDGYRFFGWVRRGVLTIRAGCRNMTLSQYRRHNAGRRADYIRLETTAILDHIEAVARIRGLLEKKGE